MAVQASVTRGKIAIRLVGNCPKLPKPPQGLVIQGAVGSNKTGQTRKPQHDLLLGCEMMLVTVVFIPRLSEPVGQQPIRLQERM